MSRDAQRSVMAAAAVLFLVLAVVFAVRGGPAFSVVGYLICAVAMAVAFVRSGRS